MTSICRALAAAILLASTGAAFAQGRTIEDYVRSLIADNVDPDERLVGRIETRDLEEDEEVTVYFNLDPAKFYFVYGACDDDCSDLNLSAEDGDGDWVDSDEEDDDAPMIVIVPGEAGSQLAITAHMVSCEADTCVTGIGLYEADF